MSPATCCGIGKVAPRPVVGSKLTSSLGLHCANQSRCADTTGPTTPGTTSLPHELGDTTRVWYVRERSVAPSTRTSFPKWSTSQYAPSPQPVVANAYEGGNR